MRDLSTNELGQVYGAGGNGCSPKPPSCGNSKNSHGSHGSHKSNKGIKAKHSGRGSGGHGC